MISLVDTREDDYDFYINDWLLEIKYADRGKMVRNKPQNFPFYHHLELMRKNDGLNPKTSNFQSNSGPSGHSHPYASNYSYSTSDSCSVKSSNDAKSPNSSKNGSAMLKLYEKLKTRKYSDLVELKDSCNVNNISEDIEKISLTPMVISENGDIAKKVYQFHSNREQSTPNENQNQNPVNSRLSLLKKLQSYKQRKQ